jgi:multimeric flavodoxin WrbA
MNTLMIKPVAFEEMVSALNDSSGVILSTPVYFGDRSSVANKFLQIASVKKLLKNKVFGMVSVGAKRNGGQETANIFGLFEALNQNALAVGNGPPTCQYGGTAVGGNKGNVLDDKWGLETAKCTGIRVAQVAEMIVAGSAACNFEKIKITILSTMDTKQKILRKFLDKTIAKIEKQLPWVEFSIVELIDLTIYRCLGCSVCPLDKKKPGKKAYCIIKDPDDSMEMVREKLNRSDAVVLAGLNILDSEKLIFRYQVFMERMRFIRRNDFELSNLLFTGLCYHQVGATINPIHNLKTITSYIRHNTIVHKHIDVFEYNGQIIESGFNQLLEFCHTANLIKAGRKKVPLSRPVYDPYGQSSGYLKSL